MIMQTHLCRTATLSYTKQHTILRSSTPYCTGVRCVSWLYRFFATTWICACCWICWGLSTPKHTWELQIWDKH